MKSSRELFGDAVNIDWIKDPKNNQTFAVEESEVEKHLAQGYIHITEKEAVELTSMQ